MLYFITITFFVEEELKRLNEALNEGYSAVGFSYNAGEQQAGYNPEQPTGEQTGEAGNSSYFFMCKRYIFIDCQN